MSERKRTSDEQFMTAYIQVVREKKAGTFTGAGNPEVARRLGLKPTTVTQRASKIRNSAALPHMPSTGVRVTEEDRRRTLEKVLANLDASANNDGVVDTKEETEEENPE